MSTAANASYATSEQLLRAMHDRYAGTWYHTLTFVQTSTFLRDSTNPRVETWYEAGAIPGRLRIDIGNPSLGNGVLYRGDSLYAFQGGKLVTQRTGQNPLMVLGFDVYAQPVARTMSALRAERIDLGLIRRDTLYGKAVWVVGAGPGDGTKNQFWVEADRLLFVRLIQSDTAGRNTRDIRFEQYIQHGGGWVAERVRMLAGGRDIFREEYSNVRVDVPLDTNIWVPAMWSSATHWYRP